MKKTTSIHIKGIQFIVEETAFETLQSYLNRLESKLSGTEGKTEIIEDIELRIAELFSDIQAGNTSRVIVQEDVDTCMAKLGEPEDYIDGSGADNENQSSAEYMKEDNFKRTDKKLYRDVEKANIAGVCSGLAAYFSVDVIIVRILFLIILFFAGFGLPLYIILWIVLPKATSHVDRLRMQGKPVTVENVRDEVEMAAKRMSEESSKFARKINRDHNVQQGINSVGRVIRVIIGLFFLFIGTTACVTFLIFLVFQFNIIPVSDANGLYSAHQFTSLFWENTSELNIVWSIGLFVTAVLIAYVLISGVKLVFNMSFKWFKYLSRTALATFVIGVVLMFYIGTSLTTQFLFESEVERTLNIDAPALYLETNLENNLNIKDQKFKINENNRFWLVSKNGRIYHSNYSVHYIESKDSLFHVTVKSKSQGPNQSKANKNAQNIDFKILQNGDTLSFAKQYNYPIQDKIRGQEIELYIQIPANKSVFFQGKEIKLEPDDKIFNQVPTSRGMVIHGDGKIEIWN
ncbi:MAG: PspC domain-containing protein [Bacteroidetes bacterium]|nr:PspC domain-containing protein [Bacteroidota bacterium]